ncbi:hypothetical protein B7628_08365 [Salmonella enterica]|nr:hypothetical protein [Salmonella enterica]
MSALENLLEYYPLSLAAQKLNRDEIELLLLGHAGQITFHQYPDPANLIGCNEVSVIEIGSIIIEGTKTGKEYQRFTAGLDVQKTDLVLTKAEMERAHRLLNPLLYADQPPLAELPVNRYAERHATNREQLYKVAIGVLADYPDECRGPRKEFSPAKWRNAMLKHAKEYPVLMITDPDTIEDHLAAAVNIKARASRKGGK